MKRLLKRVLACSFILCMTGGAVSVSAQLPGTLRHVACPQGFVTLAFDATHQGESEGEPHYIEIPTERVEDIRSAVDYLTTLPQVDASKIGILGICAGGGYSISAAQTEHRIKALATVSAVDVGNIARQGWDVLGGSVAEQIKALEAIAAQRTAEANGASVLYVHNVPTREKITADAPHDIVEASEYYTEARGQYPTAKNLVM